MNAIAKVVLLLFGVIAMSSAANIQDPLTLVWEWPANRAPETVVTIVVTELKKQKKSWFSAGRSPSIANNLPDPTVIKGSEISSAESHRIVSLTLPGLELPVNLKIGDHVKLSVVNKTTCIAIAKSQ